ncbi:MAG: hypothetical protein NTZ90_01865 [Proteobacteria bacterium]|nr:hypothetical protein [Pseudomonadota bacterium]
MAIVASANDKDFTMNNLHLFGVWLDHRKAKIVELCGDDVSEQEIESNVERHTHSTGGTQLGGRAYISAMGSSERRLDERRGHEITLFYQTIAKAISRADEIAVLGSGVARGEFIKYLEKDSSLADRVAFTGPSRVMTGPQLVARFKTIFHMDPPRQRGSKDGLSRGAHA